MSAAVSARPDWVNAELMPFESGFLEIDGNSVHYVDEGDGPVLLMLHGNPAWSFLFRNMIERLRGRYRCVAPDLPGFGLSTARVGYGFSPVEHAGVVEVFVERLDLRGVTMFVQDWGGPIGLWTAARDPGRYHALVIGNTWAWPVDDDPHFARFSSLMGGPIGRFAIRNFNAFVNVLVPMGHRRRKLTREEMRHYRRPFPTRDSRRPTSVFPREIVASSEWLGEVEAGLDRLSHLPALVLWGDADIAFRAQERERFRAVFPRNRTHVLRGAGHFIWDDAPDEVAAVFEDWWPSAADDMGEHLPGLGYLE